MCRRFSRSLRRLKWGVVLHLLQGRVDLKHHIAELFQFAGGLLF